LDIERLFVQQRKYDLDFREGKTLDCESYDRYANVELSDGGEIVNRMRFLAVTMMFLLTMTVAAQQTATGRSRAEKDDPAQHATAPNADDHLRLLTEKLDLTVEQQGKLRPIIQNMLDERQKLLSDPSQSSEQRHEKLMALHEKADHEARKFLNEDQKKKLDELKAQHHPESSAHDKQ
jgi:hypothetical protein